MSKGLKNMTLDELERGYEKGKVTDEEIEQNLLGQIHKEVRDHVKYWKEFPAKKITTITSAPYEDKVMDLIEKLAEHEYQKLKDNE